MSLYSVAVLAADGDRLSHGKHFQKKKKKKKKGNRFVDEQPPLAQTHIHHRTPYPYYHGISLRPKVMRLFPARPFV